MTSRRRTQDRLTDIAARVVWLLLSLLMSGCGPGDADSTADSASGRPNVLLLVMDTVRADRCSVNGFGRPTTPRLERLAQTGVRFSNAFSHSPWTGPSHASIFTGLEPQNHGFHGKNRYFLREADDTLAEFLARDGYATGCFTANMFITARFGMGQGFGTHVTIADLPDETYPVCRTMHKRALEFVDNAERDGKPWFLFVNDMEAHLPYTPTEEAASRFLPEDADPADVAWAREFREKPQAMAATLGLKPVGPQRRAILEALYQAEIAILDAEVGVLLDGLASRGLLDETLVVVTSDHGENLGDHGEWSHLFGPYRTLIHVPLVIRFPGRFGGGRDVAEVVRLADLLPTILEVCGVALPARLDGTSLTDLGTPRIARALFGNKGGREEVEPDFPEIRGTRFMETSRSAVEGRYHLIRYSDDTEELFDMEADPGEEQNRIDERGDVRDRLRALLPSF